MTKYNLSIDAELELEEIADYTIKHWGWEAFERYFAGLRRTFEAISDGSVIKRQFNEKFPGLFVTSYSHHYVFYYTKNRDVPMIIGVIHERMNVFRQLNLRVM